MTRTCPDCGATYDRDPEVSSRHWCEAKADKLIAMLRAEARSSRSEAMNYESKVVAPREPFAAVGGLTSADLYAAAGLLVKLPASVQHVIGEALEHKARDCERRERGYRRRWMTAAEQAARSDAAECRALLDAMGGA